MMHAPHDAVHDDADAPPMRHDDAHPGLEDGGECGWNHVARMVMLSQTTHHPRMTDEDDLFPPMHASPPGSCPHPPPPPTLVMNM